jgi:hypothetical protein
MRAHKDQRAPKTHPGAPARFAPSLPRWARQASSAPTLPGRQLSLPTSPSICSGAQRRRSAPLRLRLQVWLTRWSLDRRIAAGDPPERSAALELRAHQLLSLGTGLALARSLRRVVADADRSGRHAQSWRVVTRRAAVGADRELLLGLAERLETGASLNARAVALVEALLTDGVESPLLNHDCELTLAQAVWNVADALAAAEPADVRGAA